MEDDLPFGGVGEGVGSEVGECFLQFGLDGGERRYFDKEFVVLEEVGELGETDVMHAKF